jgi:hypothetical protein
MSKNKTERVNALAELMNKAREVHGQEPSTAANSEDTQQAPKTRTVSFFLRGSRALKIDAVILATQTTSRERITASDVINFALDCLPESALRQEQIKALRSKDGRRRV